MQTLYKKRKKPKERKENKPGALSSLSVNDGKIIREITYIILASSSSRGIGLLKKLKINFITEKAEIDETPQSNKTPYQLVKRLSLEKPKM